MSLRAMLTAAASLAFGATLAACHGGGALHDSAPRACYWLSNQGEGWVKFADVPTKQECFNLNSCGPGGGMSGGGCYKWATGPNAEGDKW